VKEMREDIEELASVMEDVEQYIKDVAFDREEEILISTSVAKKFMTLGFMDEDEEIQMCAFAATKMVME
jgi:hypothetical protein